MRRRISTQEWRNLRMNDDDTQLAISALFDLMLAETKRIIDKLRPPSDAKVTEDDILILSRYAKLYGANIEKRLAMALIRHADQPTGDGKEEVKQDVQAPPEIQQEGKALDAKIQQLLQVTMDRIIAERSENQMRYETQEELKQNRTSQWRKHFDKYAPLDDQRINKNILEVLAARLSPKTISHGSNINLMERKEVQDAISNAQHRLQFQILYNLLYPEGHLKDLPPEKFKQELDLLLATFASLRGVPPL